MSKPTRLRLLPRQKYRGVNERDPLDYYYWPILGRMYRRRVELALEECTGGERALEVGFGSGIALPSLHEMYREVHGLDLTADAEAVMSVFEPLGIRLNLRRADVRDMPYPDDYFDTVLLISILEHLRPSELETAFREIRRVLKPAGQAVYGTPIERPFMVMMFRVLGHDIRREHFSSEKQIAEAAARHLDIVRLLRMKSTPPLFGEVYEVGHFVKAQAG